MALYSSVKKAFHSVKRATLDKEKVTNNNPRLKEYVLLFFCQKNMCLCQKTNIKE